MTTPAFKRPESILVVIHTVAGEVLLLERVRPEGFWQSVTGSLEPGESPVQAAARELVEETGFEPDDRLWDLDLVQRFPIAPAWRHRYAPDVSENTEHAFALELPVVSEPRLDPASHRRFRWMRGDRAVSTATSWTDRAAIRHVLSATCRVERGCEP